MGSESDTPSAGATAASAASNPFARFSLPGLNLPLNFVPRPEDKGRKRTPIPSRGKLQKLFPTALNAVDVEGHGGYAAMRLITQREFTMLHVMDSLTDKPDWEEKVFNDEITEKWKVEAMANKTEGVTQKMADWIIAELRYNAENSKTPGCVIVYSGDVVKSDIAVSVVIKSALQKAVKELEDIREVYKDYHPGSDGKVLDLVHPSLFPLTYGRSRVLSDRIIALDDCIASCGEGQVIAVRPDEEMKLDVQYHESYAGQYNRWRQRFSPYSKNFQWLPSDVAIGEDGKVRFTSYINNLHPKKYGELYSVIEDVITAAIPLWNMTLTPLRARNTYNFLPTVRIAYDFVQYEVDPSNLPEEDWPQQQPRDNKDIYFNRERHWDNGGEVVCLPEPGEFQPPELPWEDMVVDIQKEYAQRGLQVIVKLANIELKPDDPEYDGGSWHVEGQMNEHICSTAIYYYDSENITTSRLAFRQRCSTEDARGIRYPQSEHSFLAQVYGCEGETAVQEVGSVACTSGRLLTFPNILQHRVQPFRLADPTKPGHRKILALFLVDPEIRVISTANVPPQQRDWWAEEVVKQFRHSGKGFAKLSTELKDKVFESVDGFPIGMDEAKEIRLELMKERNVYVDECNTLFERTEFNLCEH